MAETAVRNLIDELRAVRAQLREALAMASHASEKFRGPHISKAEVGPPKSPHESVVSLLGEIRQASSNLLGLLGEHHNFIGDFGGQENVARDVAAGGALMPAQTRY